MNKQRPLSYLSALAAQGKAPRGIIDEGRIFSLGQYYNGEDLDKRVRDVVDGLREHVSQPFELHPWAFILSAQTYERTGIRLPATFMEVVYPQKDGSIHVETRISMKNRVLAQDRFIFRHGPDGTKITLPEDQRAPELANQPRISNYPLAIAMLNTRGCSIDLRRAPSIANRKRVRQGKHPIPTHYDVDAAEYLTAIRAGGESTDRGGTHASPIPHLRRAHERVLKDGRRIWVSSALINVRNQDDISFVEKRRAYQRKQLPTSAQRNVDHLTSLQDGSSSEKIKHIDTPER